MYSELNQGHLLKTNFSAKENTNVRRGIFSQKSLHDPFMRLGKNM